MSFAKCPFCKEELEIDESFDIDFEDDYVVNRVAGHCPCCDREFQWEEIYNYAKYENLEEVS